MDYSKIIDRIIRCIIIAFAVVILFHAVFVFGFTEYKMYLPWNKVTAVQLAKDYYYQNHEREVKYSHTNILIIGETWKPYNHYHNYFYLEDEKDCVFNIDIDYNYDTGQYTVLGDTYLATHMMNQMRDEVYNTIEKIYGGGIEISFDFDSNSIKGEAITLEEFKNDTHCFVRVNTGQLVTVENKEREAKKLYSLCNKMGEMGYQVKAMYYKDNGGGMYDFNYFELPEINSIEDSKDFLDEVIIKTVK